MQSCLKHCDLEQALPLAEHIEEHLVDLMLNKFGYFVIQEVIEQSLGRSGKFSIFKDRVYANCRKIIAR